MNKANECNRAIAEVKRLQVDERSKMHKVCICELITPL